MDTTSAGAERLRRRVAERNREQAALGRPPLFPDQVYLDAVWESALTSTQKITALCYGNHARGCAERDRAWVVRERLMHQTGIRSRDTIARANADLVRVGWLEPGGHRPGHKQITVYLLALPQETSPDSVTGAETVTGPEIRTSPDSVTGPDFGQNQSQFSPKPVTESAETGHKTGTRLSTDPPQDPPKDSLRENAGTVVAAFIDGATGAGQDRPTSAIVGKVGRDARRLIGEGVPIDKLTVAADAMGRAGWNSLDAQLQRMSAQRAAQNNQRPTPSSPTRAAHQPYRARTDHSAYHQGSL
ncbi:hypothetical protein [Actinoplanes sp. NPDC049316]|uniref:hypothetical protein n=1 Tax=Actinoplanes sp. NPDC049316 TaxID=3154727 RepID=UPI0034162A74